MCSSASKKTAFTLKWFDRIVVSKANSREGDEAEVGRGNKFPTLNEAEVGHGNKLPTLNKAEEGRVNKRQTLNKAEVGRVNKLPTLLLLYLAFGAC